MTVANVPQEHEQAVRINQVSWQQAHGEDLDVVVASARPVLIVPLQLFVCCGALAIQAFVLLVEIADFLVRFPAGRLTLSGAFVMFGIFVMVGLRARV